MANKNDAVNKSIRAQVNRGVTGLSNSDMNAYIRSGGTIIPDQDDKPVVKRDLNAKELRRALEMMEEGSTYTAAKNALLEEAAEKEAAQKKDMNNYIRKSSGRK